MRIGDILIKRPPAKKYTLTGDEIWTIRGWIEKQGGDRSYVDKINKLFDEIVGHNPLANKHSFTENDLWNIVIWIEMIGGNRIYVHKINLLLDDVVERHYK